MSSFFRRIRSSSTHSSSTASSSTTPTSSPSTSSQRKVKTKSSTSSSSSSSSSSSNNNSKTSSQQQQTTTSKGTTKLTLKGMLVSNIIKQVNSLQVNESGGGGGGLVLANPTNNNNNSTNSKSPKKASSSSSSSNSNNNNNSSNSNKTKSSNASTQHHRMEVTTASVQATSEVEQFGGHCSSYEIKYASGSCGSTVISPSKSGFVHESMFASSSNSNKSPCKQAVAATPSTSTSASSTELESQPIGRFADEPEYRMAYGRRGTAIIINNKRFDARLDMPSRDGTDKDAASLELALRRLGFDVKLAHNFTADKMRDLMLRWSRADHSDADCFMCVILSHGENGVVYGVDAHVELDQLIQPFKFNRSLAGKPKLFFVQACRGTNLIEGIDSNPFATPYVSKIPMEADFLVAYSTIAGCYSWRNSLNGSWFIQSLCHVLNEHGTRLELVQLLTIVNRRVAFYYESNTSDPSMSGKRQVPCIVSMLTKELYFKPKPVNVHAGNSFHISSF